MDVVCTAGHVDHGKSTLVRALTGMEPDRFAEERERGLTIDLGFAWATLGEGDRARTVAFVDLPGHERFIGNMLAGAGAVRLALLVVAADEGTMPQTHEHLDILELLGVTSAVVALTKIDLVDTDTRAVAEALVRDELLRRRLPDAALVGVSGTTGAGLEALVAALIDALDVQPPEPDLERPRLWIDRVFTVTGAGTVVTGTLAGGRVAVGDELVVHPAGHRVRVRGLQSLKAPVTAAPPGTRLAVNLSGVDKAAVTRGDALVRAGQWRTVTAFDALVDVLPDHELDRRGAWQVHAGSAQRSARVHPVEARPLSGGGFVRVELGQPLTITAGDRFVLREAGRRATVAGGMVLDADPPPRPRGAARLARVAALDRRGAALTADDRAALLERHTAEHRLVGKERSTAAVGLAAPAAAEAARTAGLLDLGAEWAHPEAVADWTAAALAALREHHAAHPVERIASKDVAARAAVGAGCPQGAVGRLLDALVARGELAAERGGLRDPAHTVALDPAQRAARAALLAALSAQPFAPPRLSEAAAAAGASEALVRELEAAGELVRLGADIAVVTAALDEATRRLRAAFAAEGPLTAARAKDVLGTSRKYALPLLEHLDRLGRTRRDGDVRVVR
ncbi:selenocysteine-specific translation elongation factor [soil metagenome]